MAEIEQLFELLYTDPESEGFMAGPSLLLATAKKSDLSEGMKLNLDDAKDFLYNRKSYQDTARPHKSRVSRHYTVFGWRELSSADLADMTKLSRNNDQIKYLLVVVNCFSKFVSVKPLKTKRGEEVAVAFKDIFKAAPVITRKLQTDQGVEFFNSHCQQLFRNKNITHFSTGRKAAHAEATIRSLKLKIYRHVTQTGSTKYLDILPAIVKTMNTRVNKSIGIAPIKVNASNQMNVFRYIDQTKNYGFATFIMNSDGTINRHFRLNDDRAKIAHKKFKTVLNKTPKFKIGDFVRVRKAKSEKTRYYKGYERQWENEKWIITRVLSHFTPAMYNVKLDGTQQVERKAEEELQIYPNI
jgi:hypothetical protein